MHDVLPYWSWYVPELHDSQAACWEVLPVVLPNVPGLHSWQDGAPFHGLYEPSAHGEHSGAPRWL